MYDYPGTFAARRRLRNAVPAPVGFMSAIGGRSAFLPLQSDFGRSPTARILPPMENCGSAATVPSEPQPVPPVTELRPLRRFHYNPT